MKVNGIIDFHAHILPGADHGSRSINTSVNQLSLYRKYGIDRVVATPHFYPQMDSVDSFLERRNESVKRLLEARNEPVPEIYAGAEVLVCEGIDHMPGLEKLCIEGTDVILLEMPFSSWRDEHMEAVRRISKSSFTVVMAHIDRYPEKDVRRLLSECDVLCQINGETQMTFKGRKKADSLLKSYPVAAVGSDIHGDSKAALKNLLKLSKRFEKAEVFERTAYLLENAISI